MAKKQLTEERRSLFVCVKAREAQSILIHLLCSSQLFFLVSASKKTKKFPDLYFCINILLRPEANDNNLWFQFIDLGFRLYCD